MTREFYTASKTAITGTTVYFTSRWIKHLPATIIFMALLLSHCFAQSTDSVKAPLKEAGNNLALSGDSLNNKPAMYPGGNPAFTLHLLKNLRMPENYTGPGVTIAVTFTIEASGKLKDFFASDGPKALQKEAIRVIKTGGKWIPAYRDGKPATSERTQHIRFMNK